MGRSVGLKPKGRGTKGGNLDLPPFLVLCSLWPGNADVLQLVWYQQETEVNPEQHIATLGLLNLGKFATPEADAFRISNLTFPGGVNSDAHDVYIAVGSAAKGLTMNRPIDALSPLLAAGEEHPVAREEVWVALAAYDDEQLAPYAGDIRLLLGSDKPLYVTEAVSVTYDRLEMVAKANLTAR